MKKTLFFMLVFSLGVFVQAKGEDTDISLLDNVIYIDPMTAESGSRIELSVMMNNSIAAQSFGFKLSLPVGMHAVTNESGKPVVKVNSNRVSTEDLLNLTDFLTESVVWVNIVSNGQIAGNKGEIATIPIDIDSNVELTDYPLTLTDIRITPLNQSTTDPINLDQVTTTLTLTGIADTRVSLDENSDNADVLNAAPYTGVDVRVKRTINANEWSTICLPFSMTAEQCKEAFGSGVELADFDGIDVTYEDEKESIVSGIKVKFNTATTIEANHPYIIKVSKAVSEFTADNVDITAEETPSVDKDEYSYSVQVGKNKYETRYMYNSFVGTYVSNTTVPEKSLFLSDNQFWYSAGNTKMKGFRAYFDFYEWLPEADSSSARILMMFDDGLTTNISTSLTNNEKVNGEVYNLKGQRLAAPRKGINLVNGKKIVIK